MSLFLDKKYANLISSHLPLFKWTSNNVANFRCTYCGDSKKNKYKKRGFFYEMEDGLFFKCQNCGFSCHFSNFLKDIDPNYHSEYMFEKFSDRNKFQQKEEKKKEPENDFDITSLVSIENLPSTHAARIYIENRQIPKQYWKKLFYTENYCKWINSSIIPNKFKTIPETDPRIIMPFYDKKGMPFAFQGRSLSKDNNIIRYITINPSEKLLIYGLDTVDITKPIYLLEGGFDSMFIKNSLAVAGSSLKKMIKSELDIIFCFDQESRSKEIIKLMEEIIKENRKIIIWDNKFDAKDINAIVVKYSLSQDKIMKYLEKRTFQGLAAQLEFGKFKKI